MTAPVENSSSPLPADEIFSREAGTLFPSGRTLQAANLDKSFAQMREECARTMTLMRALRGAPFYRRASIDAQLAVANGRHDGF